MKKILIVFGTRPEAIKMSPLVKEFQANLNKFDLRVCITSQHREMLDQVLELFKITPDYDLDIMKSNQDLYDLSSNILIKMKSVLNDFEPDYVIVHGDTTTSFIATLSAFYQKIKVFHIEAGLRTQNLFSPWPEEGNRKLTTALAEHHFAPTIISKNNLISENVINENISVTGNTVIDALNIVLKKIKNDKLFEKNLINSIKNLGFQYIDSKFILVTGHRRENFGQGFLNICEALIKIAKSNNNIKILYPVHLNPNVRGPVNKILTGVKNIVLIDPVKYEEFVYLMSKCYFILTDSGGIQEEAPYLGKPLLLMRTSTERPEVVTSGNVKLVGSNKEDIIKGVQVLIDDQGEYNMMCKPSFHYGDGNSSKRILKKIEDL